MIFMAKLNYFLPTYWILILAEDLKPTNGLILQLWLQHIPGSVVTTGNKYINTGLGMTIKRD